MIRLGRGVVQNLRGLANRRNNHVDLSVVVQIAEGASAVRGGCQRFQAGLRGNNAEPAL